MSEIENKDESIREINVEHEMKKSYLDYAMAVIVARALPDVKDGLKPVHRRILYASNGLGLTPDKPHRKSATIVGEVLGKYHPHGDTAVYDTMVRLAQDFSMRYPLIDGHGNFGSVDGDSAAAMRYTEARMTKLSMEMLKDINKETVDFRPNFDETLKEPVVLPARFPNLLVNGSSGIAVGMSSSIPPHNLGEVINGTIAYIENEDITIPELMQYIKGPDFPTGSTIVGKENIKKAYETGRGIIKVKSKLHIEEMKNNKHKIVVNEIPYVVNKARLVEKIAEYVKDKKIEGISDLRDESDRNGLRIVIETKRDVNPNIVVNKLYKYTQLQDNFSMIMLALVNNEPKVLNLKQIIHYYVEHQRDVIRRRTQFELDKARARAHILEGLRIAIDNIDEVIRVIRAAYNDAELKLMQRFDLSEIQAKAIVDMRLKRLQGLERTKIEDEYNILLKEIYKFEEILANHYLIDEIIKNELTEIKNKFYDERRTNIVVDEGEIDIEDLIAEEDVCITITNQGYIKRLPKDTYRTQRRGGKGVTGMSTKEEDFVKDIFVASTHDYILFFTNKGKMYRLKAYEIPEARRQSKGTAIINLINLDAGEKIAATMLVKNYDEKNYLVFSTKNGIIKKTKLKEYDSSRKTGLLSIKIGETDELISVNLTDGNRDIFMVSRNGKAIRFDETDVRSMGRNSTGVKGITLSKTDECVSTMILEKEETSDDDNVDSNYKTKLLTLTKNGFGKMTPTNKYKIQKRGGKGIKTHNLTDKTGVIIGAMLISEESEIMLITLNGIIIRVNAESISVTSRDTQGVIVMKMNEDDYVVSCAKMPVEDEIEENL